MLDPISIVLGFGFGVAYGCGMMYALFRRFNSKEKHRRQQEEALARIRTGD